MSRQKVGHCRLCLSPGKLIRAHIIPEAFFRRLRRDREVPKLVTNTKGVYPKKAQIGIYDKGILCECCEPLFGTWDEYGSRLLLNMNDWAEVELGGKVIALRLEDVDYDRLKLFMIAVLWRASVSTHPFFSKVRLGPYEEVAREMIWNRDPGTAEQFAVLFSYFVSDLGMKHATTVIADPIPERWSEVKAYRFYLGGPCAYVKVDRRPFPDLLGKFILQPDKPLFLVKRSLEGSADLKTMIAAVKGAWN